MTKKAWYIENSNELDNAIATITDNFICFLEYEFVEMNYSKIEIKARAEDMASIEKILAPLV